MTRGIQHQPKALHLGSFSVCFRSSVDKAAASADNPATETILGFSGDVTEISKAAGLPRAQLGICTTYITYLYQKIQFGCVRNGVVQEGKEGDLCIAYLWCVMLPVETAWDLNPVLEPVRQERMRYRSIAVGTCREARGCSTDG